MSTSTGTVVGTGARWVDERFTSANFIRRNLNKVFPDHWSFLIGEIALYSFIILLLTGTYLTFFYVPSMEEVVYQGPYAPLIGQSVSQAYASTLEISFDVRGGLLIRQIHHWAALLFVASIVVHLLRVFFTGAFRKPREVNWLVGVTLLVLALAEGFTGYSLPDDLLSGTGLRIAEAIMKSIPVIGTWVSFLVFGGEYPGEVILGRLYVVHILLVPGILLALITAHLMILWFQKHTQFPGPGKTEHNVVGARVYPVFAAKSVGFSFLVFGVCALLGGLVQINPVWLYGPYRPWAVSAGSQPDWYIGWLEGSMRLMPNWEFRGFGYTIPFEILLPAVVLPGIIFTVMALYPFLEQRFSGDRDYHHLLDRPRDRPVRTGIGAMSLTFYIVLLLAGGNDVIAETFNISLNFTTWLGRVGVLLLPAIAYWATYRLCRGLQRHDEERAEHGVETGVIERRPSGEYIEVHAPLPTPRQIALTPVDADLRHEPIGGPSPANDELPEAVGVGARTEVGAGARAGTAAGAAAGADAGSGARAGAEAGDGASERSGNGGNAGRGGLVAVGRAVSGFFVARREDEPEEPDRRS